MNPSASFLSGRQVSGGAARPGPARGAREGGPRGTACIWGELGWVLGTVSASGVKQAPGRRGNRAVTSRFFLRRNLLSSPALRPVVGPGARFVLFF